MPRPKSENDLQAAIEYYEQLTPRTRRPRRRVPRQCSRRVRCRAPFLGSAAVACPARRVFDWLVRGLELGALRLPLSDERRVKEGVGFAAAEAAKRSEQSEWLLDRLVAGETPERPPRTLALGRVRSRPIRHVLGVEAFFGHGAGPSARVTSTFGSACPPPSPPRRGKEVSVYLAFPVNMTWPLGTRAYISCAACGLPLECVRQYAASHSCGRVAGGGRRLRESRLERREHRGALLLLSVNKSSPAD